MPNPGAPPGAAAVGAPTKVPCSPVSGRIWVAHFVWENRPTHGPPHTKRPPRKRPLDPGATEPATGGRRWSESICGSEDGRGPLPPRRGLESTPTQDGHSPVLPSPCSSDARKGAYPPGYRREPSSDWAAWISGARFFFLLPCQAGCLSVTGGAVGSLRAWPPPRERGHVAHRSRVADPPRAAFTGLITLGAGPPASRWGDRSPGTSASPAPLESVDRWPLASLDT